MNILFAAPRVPFPPTDGGRIVMFDPIRHLHDLGHEVHLVAFGSEADTEAAQELGRYCTSMTVVPTARLFQLRGLFAEPPATLARYFTARMRRTLQEVVENSSIEVVELESLHMAVYGPALGRCWRVLRPQNAEHVLWDRHALVAQSSVARIALRWQAGRVRKYEARALTEFVDSTLAVSSADQKALSAIAPAARIDCLPMGVDTKYFTPIPEIEVDPATIVMTGSFEWPPKRHNLAVLVSDVFPRIRALVPNARLSIVGKGLSGPALAEVKNQRGVEYVGAVDDIRPYIARAGVVINYVESGGGIAIKVLQAMAMAKPVVANSTAVEGITASAGRDLLVASTKAEFAELVAKVLNEASLRERIGQAARELVLASYSSARLAEDLATYYKALATNARYERGSSPRG